MSIFFSNREGQTPIDPGMIDDLIPDHLNDMKELYAFENLNIAIGIEWSKTTKKNHLDYLVWLELHKKMLCDTWRFAGKVRKTELQNSDFHKSFEISSAMRQLEGDLAYWIENKTYQDRELAARLHEKLLTIHPFKDGNGRWSRLLTSMITEKEMVEVPSWGISIQDDAKRRERYIYAVTNARKSGDYKSLEDIMYS
jgi:Fic-DOC domain mobile mystery protein B